MPTPSDPDAAALALPPDRPARRNPWYLAVFFGRHTSLDPDAMRILLMVSLGMFFENYDVGLLNAALVQIARDLGMSTSETGLYTSAIRFGGVGTFLLVPLADMIGRRRIFLVALFGMSVGTLTTAFMQTPLQFAVAQMLTRAFLLTASVIAIVILVEEFPSEHRGAGIGLFALLGGMGYGLSAGLYAAVDLLPYGWRSLYGLGIAPVLLLPFFRRSLRETRRFESHRDARPDVGSLLGDWLRPFLLFLRTHPRRAAAVCLAGFFSALGSIAVFQYTSYFVQSVHGWSPPQYTLLIVGSGLIGMLGNVVGGRGSDVFGRRRVGVVCLVLAPVFAAAFYLGPEAGILVAFGFFLLCATASDIVIRGLAAEVFPTSHRATSSGYLMLVETLGFTMGLLLIGVGTRSLEDLAVMVSGVASAMAVAGACLLFLPETRGRELETISSEPGDAADPA